MKIALIAPPYPLEEAPSPPLGLCYVAAAFEKAGATVRIIDYIVRQYTPEKLKEEIDHFQPDIVGSTAVTMNVNTTINIIKEVKAINPDIITLLGGPHATFDVKSILENSPDVDLIVCGESEETILELAPVLHNKNKWNDIRGIAFRNNNDVIVTQKRPFIKDLDTLPVPSRHLLPLSRYQALGFPVSIITSRGCPNKCIFCLGRKMVGFKVRHRSTKLVVDEIEAILSYGFHIINIADDLFTANKKRVTAFCNEIKQRNLKFKWSVFARVNTVTPSLLETMKSAGCHSISFGIESGNPEILKTVKKGITTDQAKKAIKACTSSGISTHASFMAGLPGESLKTLEDSERLSKELGIEYGYHFLAPFPGTTVRENIEEYDLEILSDDWDLYDADHAIVKTSHLDPDSIKAFVDTVELPVKEKWKNLNERFKQGDVNETEHLQVAGYHRMVMIYTILSQDLIEKNDIQNGDYTAAISSLASMIATETKLDQPFVTFNLEDLIAKGYIHYSCHDKTTRFFWAATSNLSLHNSMAG